MPGCPTILKLGSFRLFKMKGFSISSPYVRVAPGGQIVIFFVGLKVQFEAIKVVGKKSGLQDMAHLIVIPGSFQFFDRTSNGEIVDKYTSLFEGALSNSMNLPKFQITQMLDAKPNAHADHHKDQAE